MHVLGRLLAVGVLLSASVAHSGYQTVARASIGFYGPYGNLQVSRTTFAIRIVTGPSLVFRSAEFKLNGEAFEGSYDEATQTISYTPAAPLAAGPYKVEVAATYGRGIVFRKNWDVTVLPNAVTDLPGPSAEQLKALQVANRYRTRLGLPPFEMEKTLAFVAQRHADYLETNDLSSHQQTPGKPGYFGKDPNERMRTYGYILPAAEGISDGGDTLDAAFQDLYDAPYHRVPFLRAGPVPVGVGRKAGRTIVLFGYGKAADVVVSPGDGETKVPGSWPGEEQPNPLSVHGEEPREVGYPIVMSAAGIEMQVTAASGSLKLNGQDVPAFINTPLNDRYIRREVFIIPEEPLKPKKKYTAEASLTFEDGSVQKKTWTFTVE